jgi:hypothetical protein
VISPNGGHNNSGQGVLYRLKAIKRERRKAKQKRVAIVKFGRDKGIGKNNGGICVKRRTYLT